MNLKEQLNKIDHYCIDNDLHFYDLRSLYEAVEPRLSGEDKSELKKFLSNPNITVSDVNNKISTLTNEALDTDNGKMYKNLDTGEIFSLDEVRQSYEDCKYELPQYDSFEDYLDYLLQLGRYREGGLIELDDDLDEALENQAATLSDLSKGDKVYVLGRGLCTISYKGKRGMKLIPENGPVDSVVYYHPDTKKISMTKSGIYMVESLDESLQESGGSSGSRLQGKLDKFYNAIKNGKRRFRGEKVVKNKIDLNDDGTATMYVNGKAKHIKDTKKVQQILNDFKEEEEAKQQGQQPQNQPQPQQQAPQPQQQGQEQQPQQESLKEKLIKVPEDKQTEFESLLNDYGYDIESKGKTFMGSIHYQVINPDIIITSEEEWNNTAKDVLTSFINAIDNFEKENDISITWNFGVNMDYQMTAGIDLHDMWIEECYKRK